MIVENNNETKVLAGETLFINGASRDIRLAVPLREVRFEGMNKLYGLHEFFVG